MPSLSETLAEIESLGDSESREEYLIEAAERFRSVPESVAKRPYPAASQIPGCESKAYIFSEGRADGTLNLHFAVENPHGISAKALATILSESLSGLPRSEVAAISPEIVTTLFGASLSMGKNEGLRNMISACRVLARAN